MTNPYESPSPFAAQQSAGYVGPPQRPTAGTVLGIFHLILGILGVCGTVISGVTLFVPLDPQMVAQNPVLKLMHENAAYRLFNQAGILLGLVATIVLIVAGVGLLQLKPYGRQLSIGYGIYAIVAGVLGLLINALVVFPLLFKMINELPPGPEQAGAMGGAIGGICGGLIGFIYPVLVLYFMYRPNMIAAYSPKA